MKTGKYVLAALAGAALAALPVEAASVRVDGVGVWGSTTPVSLFSAPNSTWSFSFRTVTPLFPSSTADYSMLSFTLNGNAVVVPVEDIVFYQPDLAGGLDITTADDIFSLFGPPYIDAALNVLTGIYAVGAGLGGNFSSPYGSGTVTITAVPEPATWALMIGGFGAAGLVMRRRTLLAA